MKARLFFCVVVVVAALVGLPSTGLVAAGPQHIASETYYHFAVDEGRIDVRVEARVQAASSELDTIVLWAMPAARDIEIKRGSVPLDFETTAATALTPALIVATLDTPLRGKLVADLEMTYTVPASNSPYTTVSTGFIESRLVSQGPGSFMLVDLPADADNVLDPGCVLAASQPGAVQDAGFERWVCGEVIMAAIRTDIDSVQQRCARLDDRCRQRQMPDPLSAFAQSITDESRIAHLTADIEMANGAVPLSLKYFTGNRSWAETQFEIATRALPALEAVFGHPYPHDQVLLRQSNFIGLAGIAGIAFTGSGEMLISALGRYDEHTTIHELAHQWAGLNLEAQWLWEGLAEYATRRVAPGLGVSVQPMPWQQFPADDPLATWNNGSAIGDASYWYGKSGAFWQAFADAVGGPEQMTTVLSRMDADPSRVPIDGRWFMDQGEDVSGANLDALFLEWVWHPEHGRQTLESRRAAHDHIAHLRVEASARGIEGLPSDITANLNAWAFRPIEAQVTNALGVLAQYDDLLALANESGLTPPTGIASRWPTSTISAFASIIAEHRTLISLLSDTNLMLQSAEPDNPAHSIYHEARDAYNAGNPDAARELAMRSQDTAQNSRISAQMIAVAEKEAERFKPTQIARIGLWRHNPEARLAAAREAFDAGEHRAAIRLAESAYDSWNGAHARGLMRLGISTGIVALVGLFAWWMLTRVDRKASGAVTRSIREGHHIERREVPRKKRNWQDFENTP